jgi:hydrogenase/urease accessory protein HupE
MRRALLLAAALPALAGTPAHAHIRSSTGYSVIRQSGHTVHYRLAVENGPLAAAVGLRGRTVTQARDAIQDYLASRLIVSVDGVQCEGELASSGYEHREGKRFARLDLDYACPGSAEGAFHVRYGVLGDGGVIDDHRSIVDYQLGRATGTFVFDSGHHDLEAGASGALTDARRFATMGIEHILSGLDHVLFLIALLLGARSSKQVLKLATAFTAAHSVTLALGALGWVRVPPEVVEPLIALSIFYVAAENILGADTRHRMGVVFGFGLLHGLGFAGTLSFTDHLGGRLLGSLASFNVGIELGQALVVLAIFPLLLLVRRFRWSPPAHVAATAVAASVGLFWFTERVIQGS